MFEKRKERRIETNVKKKKKERKTWRVKKLFKWVTSLKLESVKKEKKLWRKVKRNVKEKNIKKMSSVKKEM